MELTGELIKEKGRRFLALLVFPIDSLNFSNGWLAKFQMRHWLCSHCIHDESGSTNMIALNGSLPEIKQQIARYNFSVVYNMDETGFLYRCVPNQEISRDRVEGLKANLTRITIAFTANADGSHKIDPYLSVMLKSPAALKNN